MLPALTIKILAIATLAAFGLGVAAWARVAWKRSPYMPAQTFIFAYNHVMTRILWRTRIDGRLELPPGQGAVIICNHRGPVDPAFIALAANRVVHWMVAKEYCQYPVLGWAFRILEVIPTNRAGIDTAATKAAIRYAHEGDLVGMLPEGRINKTDQTLLPGRPGVAMIALRARVPVIPCYVTGSPYDGTILGCLKMPAKVRLRIGKPIDISAYYDQASDRKVLEMLTIRFLVEMARLAGDPDFQPQLAGRFYKPGMSEESNGNQNSE